MTRRCIVCLCATEEAASSHAADCRRWFPPTRRDGRTPSSGPPTPDLGEPLRIADVAGAVRAHHAFDVRRWPTVADDADRRIEAPADRAHLRALWRHLYRAAPRPPP